jgi:hypothetical protein
MKMSAICHRILRRFAKVRSWFALTLRFSVGDADEDVSQRFFGEHFIEHRNLSPRTIAAYRDTFIAVASFAELSTSKASHNFL